MITANSMTLNSGRVKLRCSIVRTWKKGGQILTRQKMKNDNAAGFQACQVGRPSSASMRPSTSNFGGGKRRRRFPGPQLGIGRLTVQKRARQAESHQGQPEGLRGADPEQKNRAGFHGKRRRRLDRRRRSCGKVCISSIQRTGPWT